MRRFIFFVLITSMFIIGCYSSTSAPSSITSDETPVSSDLSDTFNSDSTELSIVEEGEFPSTYTLRADPMPWRIYPGMPRTSDIYYYEIIQGNDHRNEVGHITVAMYSSDAQANRAYEAIRAEAELDKEVQPLSIGDRGSKSGPSAEWNISDVLFELCNTIVHVSIQGNNIDLIVSYVQQLEERIEPVVCSK